MAVTAAVASGAAGAAEQNFAAAVGGKDDQGQAAFLLSSAKAQHMIKVPVSWLSKR